MLEDLEIRVAAIEARNARVEMDKAWEVSRTRRAFITLVTYLIAAVWLRIIHEPNFLFKALVPVAGYLLSTWSLPKVRIWWGKARAF